MRSSDIGPYVISEAVDSIVNRARRAVHVHVDGGLHEVYVTEVEGLLGRQWSCVKSKLISCLYTLDVMCTGRLYVH